MAFKFIIDHAPLFLESAKITLMLAIFGIILSVIIGFLCSLIIYYRIPALRGLVSAYIELSRNTPLMIQLFFLYYGFPQIGLKPSAYTCAIIGTSFLGGSYMAESFRSGLESAEKNQIESGLSIGLTPLQLMRYVIIPKAISVSIASVGANVIFLLKETSVFSAIAIADLMFTARDLVGMYYKTSESFTMLIISYLLILLPISLLLSFVERKFRHGEFGN